MLAACTAYCVMAMMAAQPAAPLRDPLRAMAALHASARDSAAPAAWAFEATFDGQPASPSQALLPRTFDYAVTHRTHPAAHFDAFASFPADHGMNCAGPDPAVSPLPQHAVTTSHFSRGELPDASFYICNDHMMSAMGDVEGYSVTAFWPRQEFDFADGGTLEFEVNLNGNHPRSWWEVLIAPRSELKIGAARSFFPIDETYPRDRIVFDFNDSTQGIFVGAGALDPDGWLVEKKDWQSWSSRFPADPANADRRIRRLMRITFESKRIVWAIEKADGSFFEFNADVPLGLPFTRGLVLLKTHAYTPQKDGNMDSYTFHWDAIRFDGPIVGRYESFEAASVAYLQANGSRPIGATETISVALPHVGANPVLFGQVHSPMRGQVLLSINGAPNVVVHPYDYDMGDCNSTGWKSFRLPMDASALKAGANTFKWTIGPRPSCVESWVWDGFSIKDFEVQFDLDATVMPTPQPTPTSASPLDKHVFVPVVRR